VYGESIRQSGRSVVDHPLPDMASSANDYWQGGVQARWRWLAGRYNVGAVRYHDVGVAEVLHEPGLTVTFDDHLALYAEYVYWRRHAERARPVIVDHSLNLALHAFF
jgi:hypothetical protein